MRAEIRRSSVAVVVLIVSRPPSLSLPTPLLLTAAQTSRIRKMILQIQVQLTAFSLLKFCSPTNAKTRGLVLIKAGSIDNFQEDESGRF